MTAPAPGTGSGPPPPELVPADPAVTAVVRGVVPLAGLRDFFDTSFRALAEVLARQGVEVRSPAFGLYRGPAADTVFDLEVGFVTGRAVDPEGDVVVGALPGGTVARVTHCGAFDGLGEAWAGLEAWIRARGAMPAEVRWESYVTQPSPEMDPRELRTELSWPLAGGRG